jgi:hypothetical protein
LACLGYMRIKEMEGKKEQGEMALINESFPSCGG